MSAPMSIFFESGVPLEETVRDLKQLLSIELTQVEEHGLVRYEHQGLGYALVLFADHGLVDDLGIRFSRYTYQCDIDVVEKGVRQDTSAALRHDLAMYLFDMIVQGRRWPAMVVFNLQELIESYEPDPEVRRPH